MLHFMNLLTKVSSDMPCIAVTMSDIDWTLLSAPERLKCSNWEVGGTDIKCWAETVVILPHIAKNSRGSYASVSIETLIFVNKKLCLYSTGKVIPVPAKKAYKGNEGMAPFIPNLSARLMSCLYNLATLYLGRDPSIPTEEGTGWTRVSLDILRGENSLSPTRNWNRQYPSYNLVTISAILLILSTFLSGHIQAHQMHLWWHCDLNLWRYCDLSLWRYCDLNNLWWYCDLIISFIPTHAHFYTL
jgi:hypothetical protein